MTQESFSICRNSALPEIDDPQYYLPGQEAVNKALYVAKGLKPIFKEKTNFFLYWIGNNLNEKHKLTIMSFLATQNLLNCTLHIYSTEDLSNHPIIKFFGDSIKVHIFDLYKEIEGTPLVDYSLLNCIQNHELNPALESDFFRLLLLYKNGGVYLDFDVLLLRDLNPILPYEFEYQWGTATNMINGAIMRLKKRSPIALEHLMQLKNTPIRINSLCWANDLYCRVKQKFSDLVIFPGAFFNTEWQMFIKGDSFFKKCPESNMFFDGAFAWHWHNKWFNDFEQGSKFDILKKNIEALYEEKFVK